MHCGFDNRLFQQFLSEIVFFRSNIADLKQIWLWLSNYMGLTGMSTAWYILLVLLYVISYVDSTSYFRHVKICQHYIIGHLAIVCAHHYRHTYRHDFIIVHCSLYQTKHITHCRIAQHYRLMVVANRSILVLT